MSLLFSLIFMFVQKKKALSYEFLNACNSSNLGYNGEIQANTKNHFKSIENTKLDTELKMRADDGVEVFVKHVGIFERYQPLVYDIKFDYDKDTKILNWTQPIENEEFKYTIYIDKINNIKKREYTLCDIAEVSKLAHYSEILTTDSNHPQLVMPDLGEDYKDFDVIILAEQVNRGKLTILSAVYNSNGETYDGQTDDEPKDSNNTGLIVLIVILSFVIIVGGILAFIIYRKYKGKGEIDPKKKETSMALITGASKDKLVESQAQEDNQQIDP